MFNAFSGLTADTIMFVSPRGFCSSRFRVWVSMTLSNLLMTVYVEEKIINNNETGNATFNNMKYIYIYISIVTKKYDDNDNYQMVRSHHIKIQCGQGLVRVGVVQGAVADF